MSIVPATQEVEVLLPLELTSSIPTRGNLVSKPLPQTQKGGRVSNIREVIGLLCPHSFSWCSSDAAEGYQVPHRHSAELMLLLGRICCHYSAWQSPDSKQEWDSAKTLILDSTPPQQIFLLFFTLEKKSENGCHCLPPSAEGLLKFLL